MPHTPDEPTHTRRRFLVMTAVGLTGLVAGACATDGVSSTTGTPAPSPEPTSDAPDAPTSEATTGVVASDATDLTPEMFAALATCVLLPEKTAGPFPLDEQFVRRDITEGYPGHPLRVGFRVVDAACAPIAGAAVEVWHCDATGDYSAFADGGGGKDEGSGTTFLRGTQVANADGIVEFQTVYPGWYRGRCVHIHLRVHVDDRTVLTSQVTFDDDYTAGVYAASPYAEFGLPDTPVERDGIMRNAASEGTYLALTADAPTPAGTGTLALLNLGVTA